MKKEGRSVVSASATCRSDNKRLCTSTRATYIWLLESLTCRKLAQDLEDWPASYVAMYTSRSLLCVHGYHIVFSYLVITLKARHPYKYNGLWHFVNYLSDQSETSTFTFWLMPPLRSRSRVDLSEFFGKQGCHRLSPTSGLSMSIPHDLYFVCKAALG